MLKPFVKRVLAWLGKPIRASAILLIVVAALLPVRPFRPVATAVTAAVLATYPIIQIARFQRMKRRTIGRLRRLTWPEKKALRRYLQGQSTAKNWVRGSEIVTVLQRDGILLLVSEDVARGFGTDDRVVDRYAIHPVAWKYLNAHRELMDLE